MVETDKEFIEHIKNTATKYEKLASYFYSTNIITYLYFASKVEELNSILDMLQVKSIAVEE